MKNKIIRLTFINSANKDRIHWFIVLIINNIMIAGKYKDYVYTLARVRIDLMIAD